MSHTRGPWHVGPHYKHDVESGEGRICECTPMGSPRAEENAAFIVRAVNAHDDLLDVLKALVDNNIILDEFWTPVNDAIAKAEGR